MTSKLLQGMLMWVFIQFLMKQFTGGKPATTQVRDASGNTVTVPLNNKEIPAYQLRPKHLDEGAVYNPIPQRLAPIWPTDSYVDIIVTYSDSFSAPFLSATPKEKILLNETKFKLGNYSDKRTVDTTIEVPAAVQHNGTLWGHFFVGVSGSVLDPKEPGWHPATAHHFAYPLTQYIPRKKVKKTYNLLEGDKKEPHVEEELEAAGKGPVISSYYHPNATWSFVPGMGIINYPSTHPAIRQFIRMEPTGARDGSGQNSWYYPLLYINTFWQLKSQMIELNSTVKTLPIHIVLDNTASWKFTATAAIEMSSKQAALQAAHGQSLPGGGDGTEIELIKEIFFDTNPILLGVTAVVSVLHVILETLAFGSDIAHYRKKKDNVGISVRSILGNAFMQLIIFLYLLDNSQNTSWIILGSQAVGILIELWKITTVVNVVVRPAPPGSVVPYRIAFEDKHKLSETEAKTKEYDEIAFKYMYMAGVPLLIAYAIYSLVYETHKSWYSYVIETLVGSVYAYGFLMMVPSLYINYRLKSVAHMPAKAMMYKFLNTFIDDLFAFTIKMPFLHRIATFRDDVIFFIYLYQRWIYKVDYTRVNEFGQSGEDENEAAVQAEKKKKEEVDGAKERLKVVGEAAGPLKVTGSQGAGDAKPTKRK